jgi:hypothetical protein
LLFYLNGKSFQEAKYDPQSGFIFNGLFSFNLFAQEKKVRIAVMPFKNVTGEAKYDWLCDGFFRKPFYSAGTNSAVYRD